ncbi:hypothetical protein OK016_06930 [Vibrio chagasii]|nr:hypothetical protein [Vibrio chagasii]
MRPLTGLDAPIHSFLEKHPEVIELKQPDPGLLTVAANVREE